MTKPMPETQNPKNVTRPAGSLPLLARRVLDEALAGARPGAIVLLEGPAGTGKSSAVAASERARQALVASADDLSDADIDALGSAGSAAGVPVLLTASCREPRLRMIARGTTPVVLGPDALRFDLAELTLVADLASVRLSRRQLSALSARTQGRPALVGRVLGALPHHVAVTDAAIDTVLSALAAATAESSVARFGSAWHGIAPYLASVPVLTDAMLAHLAGIEPTADVILDALGELGHAAATEAYGETVVAISGVRAGDIPADDAWTALAVAEYRRIGADLELGALFADAADWDGLRDLFRRRYAELLRSPDAAAALLERVPADLFARDAWLIVVERTLGAESGSPVPPRRLRKPAGAMPPVERAWLQAGKLALEIADGSFSKSVAEAAFLTRILDQADLPAEHAADLWLCSALPSFHTGNYAEAIQRLTAAAGFAERGDRPHVELSAAGLLALSQALRGDLAATSATLDRIRPALLEDHVGTRWIVPALIASALANTERGEREAAQRTLDAVRYDHLGSFWALYALVTGRLALGASAVDASLDHLRVIEQFAGDAPASNHDRGMLAGVVALLHLSIGRTGEASKALAGFNDGRESTLVATVLADLPVIGRDDALARFEHALGRRVSVSTRVAVAAAMSALAADADRAAADARLTTIVERSGLAHCAALIAGIAAR